MKYFTCHGLNTAPPSRRSPHPKCSLFHLEKKMKVYTQPQSEVAFPLFWCYITILCCNNIFYVALGKWNANGSIGMIPTSVLNDVPFVVDQVAIFSVSFTVTSSFFLLQVHRRGSRVREVTAWSERLTCLRERGPWASGVTGQWQDWHCLAHSSVKSNKKKNVMQWHKCCCCEACLYGEMSSDSWEGAEALFPSTYWYCY